LSGSIPNLKFDVFVVASDGSGTELDSDGQIVGGLESLISKLEQ
jgi:hypothetical protein